MDTPPPPPPRPDDPFRARRETRSAGRSDEEPPSAGPRPYPTWRACCWALPGLATFGIGAWIPFVVLGRRAARQGRTRSGHAYTITAIVFALWAIAWVAFSPGFADQKATWWDLVMAGPWVLGSGIAVHCFRRDPWLPGPGDLARAHRRAMRRRETLRRRAHALVARDPAAARALGVGRPDLPNRYADGGLVDVNTCPAEVLVAVARWTASDAADVTEARALIGRFATPEDLVAHTSVPAARVEAVRHLLVFT
ncbi:hypothetical protein ACN20G_10110 [Streptomyces sp. BI20]|uniref:hypothetical protein n=1 Tax=Streptomyces sp. BI20 TaxID=3403460 RepID=UPI003C70866E